MKRNLTLAAAITVFAASAAAQTNVVLYGVADAGLRLDHTNIGTLRSVGSGGESGARWGIRGTEDLGGQMTANFIFEQGLDISDNAVPQGNIGGGPSGGFGGSSTAPHTSTGSRLFSHISTVGLSGPFGEVRFGHSYNPLHLVQSFADPFGAGMVGKAQNVFTLNTARNDNAIFYDTPRLGGVKASGVYQFGESATNNTGGAVGQAKHGNDRYGAGLTYLSGPLFIGAAFEQIRSNLDDFHSRTADVAATYDFGVVKVHTIYWRTKASTSPFVALANLNQTAYLIGATVPFGAWTFLGSYGHLRDKSTSSAPTVDLGTPRATFLAVGSRYSLSKRTVLYAAYSRFNLRKGPGGNAFQGFAGIQDSTNFGLYNAGNLFGPTGSNVNPYSTQVGIRHSF